MSTAAAPLPTLTLSGLLDGALRTARAHFKRLFLPVAIPLAIANGVFTLGQHWSSQRQGSGAQPLVWTLFVLSIAAILLAKALGAAVLSTLAINAVAGRPARPLAAWAWVLRPRNLATLSLAWLAMAAGLACCIVPGIYVGVLFSLTVPVMVEEGLRGPSALRRAAGLLRYNASRALFNDSRVKCFVLSLVSWILGYALTMLLQAPFLIVQQIAIFRELAAGRQGDPAAVAARLGWLGVPAAILGTLGQVAAALYFGCGVALLYFDVRRRREGSDLEAAILAVSGLPPDVAWPEPPAAAPA